jgi:hypothetical protein
MTSLRFIGDVHGKWTRYSKLIEDCPRSLQVGDFGVGFHSRRGHPVTNSPNDLMSKGEHRFIRGNHDNPGFCRTHPFWVPDGETSHGKVFCVGGAVSIDKDYRTEGIDWWPDEELSYGELCQVLDRYEAEKPSVVVSHEAPDCLVDRICRAGGFRKLDVSSATRKMFDNMLDIHKPDLWIHGHWHVDHHTVLSGVEFIGLGELSFVDIDLSF